MWLRGNCRGLVDIKHEQQTVSQFISAANERPSGAAHRRRRLKCAVIHPLDLADLVHNEANGRLRAAQNDIHWPRRARSLRKPKLPTQVNRRHNPTAQVHQSPDRLIRKRDRRQRLIAERVTPIAGREDTPLRVALGRVLANDVIAPINVPPFDNSAVDGYAVRAADLKPEGETRLAIIERVTAGHQPSKPLCAGEATRTSAW